MLYENTPTLETERLILRKFTEADIQDILLIYGDTLVNTFLPWFPITSITGAQKYLENTIAPDYAKDIAYNYAIALKTNNRAVGYVNVFDIGQSNDMGYALHKDFWYKGITTEACRAVCDKFRSAGHPFMTATHDINNPDSGNVLKKLGMTYRYSYEELWQPKNFLLIFRMYQLNFDPTARTYTAYQKKYSSFIEHFS